MFDNYFYSRELFLSIPEKRFYLPLPLLQAIPDPFSPFLSFSATVLSFVCTSWFAYGFNPDFSPIDLVKESRAQTPPFPLSL